jgi:hypothetical protein
MIEVVQELQHKKIELFHFNFGLLGVLKPPTASWNSIR